ncbi:MAG TPA: hypothetical protein VN397_01425 [Candidatus Methylomirabilis sp.]|nr:hypothetical protein [Candidatus Methylomirabilis sp.]
MVMKELQDYVNKEIALGSTKADLQSVLLKAGWEEKDVLAALDAAPEEGGAATGSSGRVQ